MKKIHKARWILTLGAASYMLAGCSMEKSASERDTTLWVITEQTTSDGMNYQAKQAAESFETEHVGITVRIDILPTEEEQREIYLKQIRTRIMAGEGPDVYLLPTSNIMTVDSPGRSSQDLLMNDTEVDPLFQDVMQAVYNGIFADISSFYDADTDLNTDGLQQDVMNAGVIDGGRYVLPLRYTMPVVLTEPENFDKTGLTQELVDAGISTLAEYALETNNVMMAIGLRMPDDTTLLPQLFDYENGEMVITEQEVVEYMKLYQKWYALSAASAEKMIAEYMEEWRIFLDEWLHYFFEDVLAAVGLNITLDSFNSVEHFGEFGQHWSLEGFPLYADTLTGVLEQAAISQVLEKKLEAWPMRGVDGTVIAEVVYYGAVGSGCEEPELAYDFLRIFLTEDYQWDKVRPRAARTNLDIFNLPKEVQVDGMIEDSWPVRAKKAAEHLWDTLQYQNLVVGQTIVKYGRLLRNNDLDVTDGEMPILDIAIDEVRFPIYQPYEESLTYALTLLNKEDGSASEVDIDKLAAQVYRYLWWHLAEG